jgi:hypothetical protein
MSIALPPASQPINVNITIGVNAAPYFTQWFADNKLPGETPGEFLVRMIGPSVVDYAAQKALKVQQDTFKAFQQSTQAEIQSIKAAL